MIGGTLIVSRLVLAHGHIKKRFEELGFKNVSITAAEKDGLNMVINELKPRLVVIGCSFYQSCTPFLMGRLLRQFEDLNIAVVSIGIYPPDLGVCFIVNGVKSYVSYSEGPDQFYLGLRRINEGKHFISPLTEERMKTRGELPRPARELTDRQIEVLRFFCNGYTAKEIGDVMHISKRTVEFHREELYRNLQIRNSNELIRVGLCLGYVREDELGFYGGDYVLIPLDEKPKKNGGTYDFQKEKRRIHSW